MGDLSRATLSKKFRKRIEDLTAQIEKLNSIGESSKPPQLPRAAPAGLLRLPFEIRLQIYHYLIPRNRIVEVSEPRFTPIWPREQLEQTESLKDDNDSLLSEDGTWGVENNVFNVDNHDLMGENDDVDAEGDGLDVEDDAADSGNDNWLKDHACDLMYGCWCGNSGSILRLSKQISEETLDILYGENVFKIYLNGEGDCRLRRNFSEANRRRIQYLLLIAQPMGISYEPGNTPEVGLWSTILPTLKLMRIVAQQPEKSSRNSDTEFDQEMNRWIKWMKPYLECFSRHMSRGAVLQVDADGQAETSDLFKECLPGGYREIRCRRVGDFMFKRGRFSIESGYWDDWDDGPTNSRDV